MSNLTGNDMYGLIEAYQEVYARFSNESYLSEEEVRTIRRRTGGPTPEEVKARIDAKEASAAERKANRKPSGAAADPTKQFKPKTTTVASPTRKPSGAATDPFKQFPKKPQKQYGLPKEGPSSRLPGRTLAPAGGTSVRPALPSKGQTARGGPLATIPKGTPAKTPPIEAVKVSDVTQKPKSLPSSRKTSTTKPTASAPGKPPSGVKGLRGVGSKALGVAGAALEGGIEYKSQRDKGRSRVGSLGGASSAVGGGLVGAKAGALTGAKLGSVLGPKGAAAGAVIGGVGGYVAGSGLGKKAFDTVAGATGKEKAAMVTANRQKQAGTAVKGIGGSTSVSQKKPGGPAFMSTGSGSQRKTVQLSKTGVVQRGGQSVAGNLAFKGGKAVYKAGPSAQSLAKTSSNPLERVGRSLFAGAYKKSDAANAAKKLATARTSDTNRNKKLGVKLGPKIVEDIISTISTSMVYEGYSANAIITFFADSSEESIIEKYLSFDETILTESNVSEEYIEEQLQQLDEFIGAALRIAGAGLKAAKYAKGAKGIAPLTRLASGLQGAGTATSRVAKQGTKASSVVRPAISKGVQKIKDVAKGAKAALPRVAKGALIGGTGVLAGYAGAKLGSRSGDGKVGPETVGPKLVGPKLVGPKLVGPKSSSPSEGGGSSRPPAASTPGSSKPPASKPAPKPAPAGETDMQKWARLHPKLAAAKAERDRTRGTSSTTNPLMADMKSKLPATSASKPGPNKDKNQTPTTGPTPAIPDLKSVNADLKKANSPDALKKSAPSGSALAKEQERRKREAQQTVSSSYEYDAYDLVLEYLLSQGHADTLEEANYVMLEMGVEMIGDIVEVMTEVPSIIQSPPKKDPKPSKDKKVPQETGVTGDGKGKPMDY